MNDKRTVLVLDDEPLWQNLVRLLLKGELREDGSEAYEVVSANSLGTAQRELRSRVFDVALVDINLRAMDTSNVEGMEFLDELGQHYASDRTHAIMLSGKGTIRQVVDSVKRPYVIHYLEKDPLDEDRLIAEVARACILAEVGRDDHLRRRIRPLSASDIERFEVVRIVNALAPTLDPISAGKDVELLLENLLLEILPLAPQVVFSIEDVAEEVTEVRLSFWSRKLASALDVVIQKRGSRGEYRFEDDRAHSTIAPVAVKRWSVKHFEGALYLHREMTFDQFMSLHSSQTTLT